MADESLQRKQAWMRTGCNVFNTTKKSAPMSFWTEQDILQYIKENNIEICSVYGDIVQDENGKYYTTGYNRTGCVFCMFGCHLEKNQIVFKNSKKHTQNSTIIVSMVVSTTKMGNGNQVKMVLGWVMYWILSV